MQDPDPGVIRVLVLADQRLGTRTLRRLTRAQSTGLRLVGNVSSLRDAATLIASESPRVVVVDIDARHGPDTISDLAERADLRVLALTGSPDSEWQDAAVLAGAHGVVQKREAAETLVPAIRCVHEGEMWISHAAADRILDELAHAREEAREHARIRTKLARLTPDERVIATEITRNHRATPGEIATRLRISETILREHLAAIYLKLELPAAGQRAPAAGEVSPTGQAPQVCGDGHDPIVVPMGTHDAAAVRVSRRRRLRRST